MQLWQKQLYVNMRYRLCYWLYNCTFNNSLSTAAVNTKVNAFVTTYIVCDGAAQLIHSWACLCDLLGSTDDIRCILQWPFSPAENRADGSVRDSDLLLPSSIYRSNSLHQEVAVCLRLSSGRIWTDNFSVNQNIIRNIVLSFLNIL